MATKDELEQKIKNANNQLVKNKQDVDVCDQKLAKLEPVYNSFSGVKSFFCKACVEISEIFKEKVSWRGETYNAFITKGEMLEKNIKSYIDGLDDAIEMLRREIENLKKDKKNKISSNEKLSRQIRQWESDIQNVLD